MRFRRSASSDSLEKGQGVSARVEVGFELGLKDFKIAKMSGSREFLGNLFNLGNPSSDNG